MKNSSLSILLLLSTTGAYASRPLPGPEPRVYREAKRFRESACVIHRDPKIKVTGNGDGRGQIGITLSASVFVFAIQDGKKFAVADGYTFYAHDYEGRGIAARLVKELQEKGICSNDLKEKVTRSCWSEVRSSKCDYDEELRRYRQAQWGRE